MDEIVDCWTIYLESLQDPCQLNRMQSGPWTILKVPFCFVSSEYAHTKPTVIIIFIIVTTKSALLDPAAVLRRNQTVPNSTGWSQRHKVMQNPQ